MTPDPAPNWLLIDLRRERRPDLLASFIRLYDRTFTDPSEREDPSEWEARLWGTPAPGQPATHLLVAAPGAPGAEVPGGLLFEYYPRSRCGLLAYLAVAAPYRRQGLARRLVEEARSILKQDAASCSGTLHGLFAESEDPGRVTAADGPMPARERLTAMARLGAARVQLPYVQPALSGGTGRARHLLLLAFGVEGGFPRLDPAAVREFLAEYYRALGVEDPASDPDWVRMAETLQEGVTLRGLEAP